MIYFDLNREGKLKYFKLSGTSEREWNEASDSYGLNNYSGDNSEGQALDL